jgi:CheY-like chemotaxis protein
MGYKILIADDDLEDLELIEDAILHVDPQVELKKFSDGKSIVKYLDGSRDHELPCLIVLDYNMPPMNGSQVLSEVNTRERYQTIPKVVVSTSNAPVYKRECLKHGAIDYIVKPDDVEGLDSLAKRLLSLCQKR